MQRDTTVSEVTLVTFSFFAASISITKTLLLVCVLWKIIAQVLVAVVIFVLRTTSPIFLLIFQSHKSFLYLSFSLPNLFKHHFRPIFRLGGFCIFRNLDPIPAYLRFWSSSILFVQYFLLHSFLDSSACHDTRRIASHNVFHARKMQ